MSPFLYRSYKLSTPLNTARCHQGRILQYLRHPRDVCCFVVRVSPRVLAPTSSSYLYICWQSHRFLSLAPKLDFWVALCPLVEGWTFFVRRVFQSSGKHNLGREPLPSFRHILAASLFPIIISFFQGTLKVKYSSCDVSAKHMSYDISFGGLSSLFSIRFVCKGSSTPTS